MQVAKGIGSRLAGGVRLALPEKQVPTDIQKDMAPLSEAIEKLPPTPDATAGVTVP